VLVVAMISVIIPVYISARLALAVPSIVLERNNVTTALRRTQKLTLHRAGRIFGVIFLVLIVTSIIQGLIAAPSSYAMAKSLMEGSGTPLLIKIINSALQVITSAVLMPAGSIVTLLLYFDCRIRDEGYDLQVLAEEIASLNNENMNL
jgi:membrane-anchored glycerophosphoryl diester phosphodiesterase (GDPDase)